MKATPKENEMTVSDFISETKELDARSTDGIDVRLLWHAATRTVSVSVLDSTQAQTFEFSVDPSEALDAFHHPFVYAAFHDVSFKARRRAYDEKPVAA
jgi:hypothetical protein